jgi:dihydrofolate synthase / folylpolyglutamate synthase
MPDPANCSPRSTAAEFLLGRIDYERTRSMPYDPWRLGLERMQRLLAMLDHPQRDLPIVHVAGTKGKGSTSAMIAASLTAAGYRTGLFTSPHLDHVGERMTVDGQASSEQQLAELVDTLRPAIETLDRQLAAEGAAVGGPTYFEIITAAALLHFAREKADAVVLEVGLGGRLDATTACTPRVSVITSISFDHMQQLGHTLAAIAGEKAGIIKPGVPVISGVTLDEPRNVIRDVCRAQGCRLLELGRDFDFRYDPPVHLEEGPHCGRLDFRAGMEQLASAPQASLQGNVDLNLPGRHQAANAAVALATLDELIGQGWRIPAAAVRRALAAVRWPARVEVVARRPAVVLDAAHNVASIEALLETLRESFQVRERRLIFATTLEKDVRGMLARLLAPANFDEIVFTQYLENPRAVPAAELQALAAELDGRRRPTFATPREAWEAVRRGSRLDDLICITGSFFIAAEMRRAMAASLV